MNWLDVFACDCCEMRFINRLALNRHLKKYCFLVDQYSCFKEKSQRQISQKERAQKSSKKQSKFKFQENKELGCKSESVYDSNQEQTLDYTISISEQTQRQKEIVKALSDQIFQSEEFLKLQGLDSIEPNRLTLYAHRKLNELQHILNQYLMSGGKEEQFIQHIQKLLQFYQRLINKANSSDPISKEMRRPRLLKESSKNVEKVKLIKKQQKKADLSFNQEQLLFQILRNQDITMFKELEELTSRKQALEDFRHNQLLRDQLDRQILELAAMRIQGSFQFMRKGSMWQPEIELKKKQSKSSRVSLIKKQ